MMTKLHKRGLFKSAKHTFNEEDQSQIDTSRALARSEEEKNGVSVAGIDHLNLPMPIELKMFGQ